MSLARPARWAPLASATVLGVHAAVGWGLSLALDRPAGPPLQRGALQVTLLDADAGPTTLVWPGAGAEALLQPVEPLQAEATPPQVLTVEQVDESARPQSDWTLAGDDLAALGLVRIEFEAWVTELGTLDAVRVLRVEPAAAASLAPLLERRLLQTAMLPARKNGTAVAQRLVVELGLSPGP